MTRRGFIRHSRRSLREAAKRKPAILFISKPGGRSERVSRGPNRYLRLEI
jgi:hypothetical protein